MISKILEASTVHMPEGLDRELHRSENLCRILGAQPLDVGWLFFVRESDSDYDEVPSDKWNVTKPLIEMARSEGAAFILLDPAAPIVDGLPEYDWE